MIFDYAFTSPPAPRVTRLFLCSSLTTRHADTITGGLGGITTDLLRTDIMTTDPVDRTDVTRVMTLQVLALYITQLKLIPVLPSGVTNATSSITLQHIALL